MKSLSPQIADAIYDVLVEECGAPEGDRTYFVANQTREVILEWRFQGRLGFGGKFRRRRYQLPEQNELYVDCYSEDKTPARQSMIETANKRLEELEPCQMGRRRSNPRQQYLTMAGIYIYDWRDQNSGVGIALEEGEHNCSIYGVGDNLSDPFSWDVSILQDQKNLTDAEVHRYREVLARTVPDLLRSSKLD